MNLFDYPKQYFDIFFKGKHPRKFVFTENLIELVGVLIFVALLQGIVGVLTNQAGESFISDLLIGAAISLISVLVLAAAVRAVFLFCKGKGKFQDVTALFTKYAASLIFWSGIAGITISLIALNNLDFIALSIAGMVYAAFMIYLLLSILPTFVEKLAKIEKVKQPKADMIFALAIVLLVVVIFAASLFSLPADLMTETTGLTGLDVV